MGGKVEHRRAEMCAAQVWQQQRSGDGGEQQPENEHQPSGRMAGDAHHHQIDRDDAQRRQRGGATMRQPGDPDDQNQYPQQQHK
jgi:hypothetical protein